MRRPLWLPAAAIILSFSLLVGGCGSTDQPTPDPPAQSYPQPSPAPPPVETPPNNPSADPPEEPAEPGPEVPDLPGDTASLKEALKAETPVTYTIIVADDAPREMDKTLYLDQMLTERGYPKKNEILLVIFPQDNHNIRFALGALVFDRKISLESMLEMVQNQYLTRSRRGDPAGGLAALITAINEKVK